MSVENELDLNTLIWVKSEIDGTLNQARKALEVYVEDQDDASQLQFCLNYLHQVRGTLQMVELYGAALAAEEMENLVQALINGKVGSRDDGFEVLIRGVIQLPDYLEHLLEGHQDTPMLLLPLLNDLRAARGAPLLSENALFTPDLSVPAPLLEAEPGDISELARKLRHHYHLGLLGWYRDKDSEGGLKRIAQVIEKLRASASEQEINRLFWVAGGLVESLLQGGLDSSVSVKLLLGQLDRQIKKIIDKGEFALSMEPPSELLKNLLYYVANSKSEGDRTQELKTAFKLDEILPDIQSLEQARADLAAPNAALMSTVSSVLMEDLLKIKDNLDLFVRTDKREVQELKPLRETLSQMADTLGMLGLGIQRESVQEQVGILEAMLDGGREVDDSILMEMASAMLALENSLNEVNAARAANVEAEAGQREVAAHHLRDAEQQHLLSNVVEEAQVELEQVKNAINQFSKNPADRVLLEPVPAALDRIKGGISILNLDRAAQLLQGCIDYIRQHLLEAGVIPDTPSLDSLADAISSIEYYLESLAGKWGQPEAILDVAEQSLEQLQQGGEARPDDKLASLSELHQPDIVVPAEGSDDDTLVDVATPALDDDEITLSDQSITETLELGPEEETLIDISSDEMAQPDEDSLHGLSIEGFDATVEIEELNEEAAPSSPTEEEGEILTLSLDEAIELEPAADEDLSLDLAMPSMTDVPAPTEETFEVTEEEIPQPTLETKPEEVQVSAPEPAAEPAPAPRPAAPIAEIDDEIIEIFLEEGEEELARINELLPKWCADNSEEEALKELRRSFHTLKGSGRLVGAFDIGEFAWSYENMLNRVIDHTIEPSVEMVDILEQARQMLPVLFELFKQNSKAGPDVLQLMEQATALSQGKSLAQPAGKQPEEKITETATEEAPQPLPELDPVLLDIYRKEVDTHLATLKQYLNDWENGVDRSPSHALMRALHTLTGSSRTTSVTQVAELCGRLEQHVKELQQRELEVTEAATALLADCLDYIAQTTAVLDQPGAQISDNGALLARLDALTQGLSEAVQASPTPEPAAVAEVAAEAAVSAEALQQEEEYDEELLEIFIEEGEEILNESDSTLHHWMGLPEDQDDVEAMQRYLHTLKGGARMAGVASIGDLSHRIESMLTAVVDGHLPVSKAMFDLLLKAQDRLAQMVDQLKAHRPLTPAQDIITEVNSLLERKGDLSTPAEAPAPQQSEADSVAAEEDVAATESLQPEPPEIILADEVDELVTALDEEDDVELITTESFTLADAPVVEESPVSEDDVNDIPEILVADFSAPVEATDTTEDTAENVVDDITDATIDVEASSAAAEPETETVQAAEAGDDNIVQPAPQDLEEPPAAEVPEPARERRKSPRVQEEQVRVKANLLDNLVNFAGEVSIYRARMEQQTNSFRGNLQELDDTVSRLREQLRQFEIETEAQIQYRQEETLSKDYEDFDPLEFDRFTQMQHLSRSMLESLSDLDSLRNILANINRESETLLLQQSRVNTELQEGLMRTRLVPFTGVAPRLRRIVRQTCDELGKKIELHLSGLESELDRTVMDKIIPPLEHMLRNAVSHGIEKPEVRVKAAKPETGNVHLSFRREGSDIIIEIQDDGAGLDLKAIRDKAVERGMLKADVEVSRDVLLNMIMESGFSTAEKVTQISGRGVGMDVVNSAIKQLGGLVDTKTEEGKGTTFTISLPLTLAISRALMVTVGEDTYAIPLLSIQGVERISRAQLEALAGEENPSYEWVGEEYQLMNLGEMMGLHNPTQHAEGQKLPLLMVRSGDFRTAILVDGLIGSREIVVKPVGPQLSSLRGVAGATIMGDGSVVLILDLGVLIRMTMSKALRELVEIAPKADLRPTVMVVDDSITVRKVTSRLLSRHDYQIIAAKDGVDALSQLQETLPDVMLLDVEMPRMDGFELATNMRNDERLKDIPIIMITSRTGQKHRDRALNIGVNMYMGKPYSEDELLENIRTLIQPSAL